MLLRSPGSGFPSTSAAAATTVAVLMLVSTLAAGEAAAQVSYVPPDSLSDVLSRGATIHESYASGLRDAYYMGKAAIDTVRERD